MPESPHDRTVLRPERVSPRRVGDLLDRLPQARLHGDGATLVGGMTHDSRQVREGDIYLARAGEHTHGIVHVDQALARGATAVLTDPESAPAALAAGTRAVVE